MEKVVLGGGCFWCTDAVFKMIKGIKSVTAGYAGGSKTDPTYSEVSSETTGHAEVVEIEYDPRIISFRDLLAVFFATHDPTTINRQGADIGPQYRSAIYYTSEEQKNEAEAFIKELNGSSEIGAPIVTEVRLLDKFYKAENYHQDYAAKNPENPYVQAIINPKLKKVKEKFSQLSTKAIKKIMNEEEFKKKLTPEQYKVLRERGTEAPFSGRLELGEGVYKCMACGNSLFSSDAKFESGTGWPSFDEALPGSVELKKDNAYGMKRTEVVCKKCGSHLGHVFNDGPTETGKRYCINAVCLGLESEKKKR